MRRVVQLVLALAVVGMAGFWLASTPVRLPDTALDGLSGDPAAGRVIFAAAGCAACHSAPAAAAAEPPVLAGGKRFETTFGTFIAPNISSDPVSGIGAWSDLDLANAIARGVSPDGAHYYPAFPYASYARIVPQDLADLIAYLRLLPADPTASQKQEVAFPFSIRRTLGLWKRLFVSSEFTLAGALADQPARGRYLAEALGHCAECHTPRNALGGLRRDQWLAGAPNPDGEGRTPNITPGRLTWSEAEIAEYLNSGFTPEFDTAGSSMAEVVRNTAQLTDADRLAIAAYLKAVPAIAPALSP